MTSRAAIAIAVATLSVPLLAGCANTAAAPPAPAVTVTATVTATPEPAPSATSPDAALTEWDAWLLCWGATFGENGESATLFGYAPESASGGSTVTDNGDGTFEVLVPFAADGRGAESICVAGGTVGEPTVDLQGARDFG